MAHGALASIALPVSVDDEADGRIEREARIDTRKPLRIERQHALQSLKRIEQHDPGNVEDQHGRSAAAPGLVTTCIDPAEAVENALDRSKHPAKRRAAFVDCEKPLARGFGQRDDKGDVAGDERPSGRRSRSRAPQNFSGRSNAVTR